MPDDFDPKTEDQAPAQASECRALVPLAPVHSAPAARPLSGFVTQLIACERRLGAYKVARRASASDAVSLYAGAVAPGSAQFERLI
jgi:hypothetical protein